MGKKDWRRVIPERTIQVDKSPVRKTPRKLKRVGQRSEETWIRYSNVPPPLEQSVSSCTVEDGGGDLHFDNSM